VPGVRVHVLGFFALPFKDCRYVPQIVKFGYDTIFPLKPDRTSDVGTRNVIAPNSDHGIGSLKKEYLEFADSRAVSQYGR